MKRIFSHFSFFMGNFPRISAIFILVLSILIPISLMAYVNKINGLEHIINFERTESLWLMGSIIVLLLMIVVLRIDNVNKTIKRRVYFLWRNNDKSQKKGSLASKYVSQERDNDDNFLAFISEFKFKGNIFKKTVSLIAWHPEPFAALFVVLFTIYVATVICYKSEPHDVGFLHSWLWRNCPWIAICSIIGYLIINDWLVMRAVSRFLKNIMVIKGDPKENSPKNATEKLTPTEQIVYTKRRKEGKNLKQIADEMNVSVGTIKTHINNIGKKLREEAS